jgi:hypothetical protein
MPSAWSLQKRLYGTDQAVPDRLSVALGPITFSVEGPQVRHLSIGGHEVVRAAGLVIRDAWWGSHVLHTHHCDTQVTDTQWLRTLQGSVQALDNRMALAWALNLRIQPGGVTLGTRLLPQGDFTTCRAGLAVLHPLVGVTGAPVTVTHSDGQVQEGCFPELISPSQPFFDIRELRYSPLPGLELQWRLIGDVFEMEDQRNWGDASFKTYNRPLAWPCPYVLKAGSCVEQQVELRFTGGPAE